MRKIKVMQVGLGPVGQKMVSYAVERQGIEVIAAVDPAPGKAGADLGELCSLGRKLGIKVSPDIDSAVKKKKPHVALLTTVSGLEKIVPQIEEIAEYGINVISTCEELAFPWDTNQRLAKKLDRIGRKNKVSILGTGVNPGFLMDFLPIAMTAVCQDVRSIRVSRVQDATSRRVPFQQKIGAGLTLAEFEKKKMTGTLRHVGLTESMHMIAARMGWKLDRTEDVLTPIIAGSEITTDKMRISPGMSAGVQQIGRGYAGGREVITLVFRASIGEKDPADTVDIKGTPDITSTIKGGINGDIATCAITINAIKQIINAEPGLRTMEDIPAISFFGVS